MIILVVLVHAAITYSGIGSWYYKESVNLDPISNVLFSFFLSFTQAYFMGFLFLLSGYFVPGSFDKKGFSRFIKDRLIRLGIPTLLYMLLIYPFIKYFLTGSSSKPTFMSYYLDYIVSLDFIGGSGPLWFALALLIFTICYGLMRLLVKKQPTDSDKEMPGFKGIVFLIVLIAICTFAIRIVQPIGSSIYNMQLSFFSQYIILFIIGILAYRNRWFSKLEYKFGIKWLKAATIPGIILWIIIILTSGALEGKEYFTGGLRWQSAAYSLWESFTAVAMSIGLTALFKEKFNKQNKFMKVLADNSFAVYVFHAPILVMVSIIMQGFFLPPIVKFLIASIVSLAISFTFANYVVKKTPFLNKIIK